MVRMGDDGEVIRMCWGSGCDGGQDEVGQSQIDTCGHGQVDTCGHGQMVVLWSGLLYTYGQGGVLLGSRVRFVHGQGEFWSAVPAPVESRGPYLKVGRPKFFIDFCPEKAYLHTNPFKFWTSSREAVTINF